MKKKAVTTSFDGTAKIWDVKTGRMLLDLKVSKSWVTYTVFSPNGKWLLTSSDNIHVWNASTGNNYTNYRFVN